MTSTSLMVVLVASAVSAAFSVHSMFHSYATTGPVTTKVVDLETGRVMVAEVL